MPPSGDDHFAAFVDRVAQDLDAAPRDGAALAADAGLSRFHFERVITAVAGESPTRFRARILLERAAYRLVVSEISVLDAALDAGFESHEGFTRAFARAYGAPPARWRRRPSRFTLDSPNSVHFAPPAGLRLPGRHRMSGVDVVVEMVEHHVWLVGQLVERAERLTDGQLDHPYAAPVEDVDGDDLRWTLSRLIGQMAMWNAAVAAREYDFSVERHESVMSMRRRLARTGPEFVAGVRTVADEGRFDDTFVEAFSPRPVVMTYGAMVAHVLTFAAHHRLLAVARLAECGITDLELGDPKSWFNPPRPA